MRKSEIISDIAYKTGIDKEDVSITLEAFFSIVKASLAAGEPVHIRHFGSFLVKKRAAKIGRNIKAKESVEIPERTIPAFKPAKVFMEKVRTAPVLDREDDLAEDE